MEDGDSNNPICLRSNKYGTFTENIIWYYVTTRCTMKTDKYTSKMNGTTVFVKGYSASVGRMHVETLNAPGPRTNLQITPNHRSHKSLIMNSCKEKQFSPDLVTSKNW